MSLVFNAEMNADRYTRTFQLMEKTAVNSAKKINDALDDIGGGKKGGSKSSHGGSNLMWGLHDIAEGRITNGLFRLSAAFKLAGPIALGAFAAYKLVGDSLREVKSQMDDTEKANERLNASFITTSRAAAFSSSGEGPLALGEKMEGLRGQIKGENEQQGKLQGIRNIQAGEGAGITAPISTAIYYGWDQVRSSNFMPGIIGGKDSNQKKMIDSRLREGAAASELRDLTKKRSESLRDESEIAQAKGPGRNPVDAKRMELDLQEKVAIAKGKEAGYSAADLKNVQEKFAALKGIVAAEENVAVRRYESSISQLETQGSGRSSFRTRLINEGQRIKLSEELLKSGLLNEPQKRAEVGNLFGAENERQSTLMGRYLNGDGTRRRQSDINRDFRQEVVGDRNRKHFMDLIAQGKIDPETGRRIHGKSAQDRAAEAALAARKAHDKAVKEKTLLADESVTKLANAIGAAVDKLVLAP